MDVIARPVAFVEMLVAAHAEQVELIDQAVALEQIQGPVHRHAVHARIELLRALQNRSGIQVALGVVHDLEQNFPLARQAHAALFQGRLQAAWAFMRVDALSGGDSMCGSGHGFGARIRDAQTLSRH